MGAEDINRGKVSYGLSAGKVCFWCEESLSRGSPCVRVKIRVKIPTGIASVEVTEEGHVECVKAVAGALTEEANK